MSAFTTFVINDGAATPVAITYSPEIVTAARTELFDRRLESRDLQPSIYINWSAPTASRKTYRASTTAALPLVRNVAGVDLASSVGRANCDFVLPTTMTEQERKHLFAMIVNTMQHVLFKDVVYKLDPIRG